MNSSLSVQGASSQFSQERLARSRGSTETGEGKPSINLESIEPAELSAPRERLVTQQPRVEAPPAQLDPAQIAESLTDLASSLNRDLQFSVDESSGRTVVTVLDGETQEVIRQIPSEQALRLAERLQSADGAGLSGLLDIEA